MAAAFVALAVSMFGLFDLQAPRWWRDRFGAPAAQGDRSPAPRSFLGFSSALVVGPCVTPPLAAALLYVAQTGNVLRGALALFALGLGWARRWCSSARSAPASCRGPARGWSGRSRPSAGFPGSRGSLVTRLLPDGLSLLLWAALAIGTGMALAVLTTNGRPPARGRAAGLVAVAYGGLLLLGAATGADDPLRPLAASAKRRQPVSRKARRSLPSRLSRPPWRRRVSKGSQFS